MDGECSSHCRLADSSLRPKVCLAGPMRVIASEADSERASALTRGPHGPSRQIVICTEEGTEAGSHGEDVRSCWLLDARCIDAKAAAQKPTPTPDKARCACVSLRARGRQGDRSTLLSILNVMVCSHSQIRAKCSHAP